MNSCEACASPLLPGAFFCGECGSSTRPRLEPSGVQRSDTQAVPMSIPPQAQVSVSPTFAPPPPQEPVQPPAPVRTVIAPPVADPSYTLTFANGDAIRVTSGGLLGRNPVAESSDSAEHLIIVTDPDRTVSKTHLEFGIEDESFWICDRFSGNGTTVTEPSQPGRRLVPGRRYRIERGSTVEIGDQTFTVA